MPSFVSNFLGNLKKIILSLRSDNTVYLGLLAS